MTRRTGASVAIEVDIRMGAPSFVPGSRVTATITLRTERKVPMLEPSRSMTGSITQAPPATGSRFALSASVPPGSVVGAGLSSASSSHIAKDLPHSSSHSSISAVAGDEFALIDYVVCEVAGRWSSDRSWVVPDAHESNGDILDNHRLPPVAAPHGTGSLPFASTNSSLRPARGTSNGHSENAPHTNATQVRAWDAALADANSIGGGGRPGHCGVIFRSQPLVVCEREQVPIGSQTSFSVECVLPDKLPPTLRGTAMRYTYACVVVVALPDSVAPKVVRVPFRVVSADGTASDNDRINQIIPVPTPRSVGPKPNRFLEKHAASALSMSAKLLKSAPPDDIEIALALSLNGRLTPYTSDGECRRDHSALEDSGLSFIREDPSTAAMSAAEMGAGGSDFLDDYAPLERIPAKRNVVPVYAITRGRESIARMYLARRVHHLGDTLSAIFYFNGEKPCYRLGARLEAQEVVNPRFSLGAKQTGTDGIDGGVVFRKVYGEHGEFVMSNRNTHVTFSIPHDAPASFSTDVVTVRWLVHFVFLIPRSTVASSASHTNGHNAQTTESAAEEIGETDRLVQGLSINGDLADDETSGWEGGNWTGDDPATWKHLPDRDVDVLRWTLPLIISGEPDSQWGVRSSGTLRFSGPGS